MAESPKLWMVSANNATVPVRPTTTNWTTAVARNAASEILVAQTPQLLANISPSTARRAIGVIVAYLASVCRSVVNVHPLITGTLEQLCSPNLTPGGCSP